MTYTYQVISVCVQWDHGFKSFCVTIVYLQTMRGFHVEDGALVICTEGAEGAGSSGLLKKQV